MMNALRSRAYHPPANLQDHRQIGHESGRSVSTLRHARLVRSAAAQPVKTHTDLDVAIVGGGPAGLAAAHALSVGLPGARIAVYERVPQLMRRGAGFGLDINGQKALHAINPKLLAAAEASGRRLTGFNLHGCDGSLFKAVSSAETISKMKALYGHSVFLLAWSDMQQLLAQQLPPGLPLHLGQHVERFEQADDGNLVLHLADQPHPITAKLLVAADGYFSRARQQCLRDGPPAFAGTMVWRGRLRDDAVLAFHEHGTELTTQNNFTGNFCSFSYFPVSGDEAVWVGSAPDAQLKEAGINFQSLRQERVQLSAQAGEFSKQSHVLGAAAKERALKLYDTFGFAEPIKRMIRDTEESTIVEHGIYTRSGEDIKPEWFGRGRVAIIGDAAHPMRPAGQGLNQAIEDAYHLAHELQKAGGISEAALASFRAIRAERMKPIILQSAQIGMGAYKKSADDASSKLTWDEEYTKFCYGINLQPLGQIAVPC